jgi:hypothetical protein
LAVKGESIEPIAKNVSTRTGLMAGTVKKLPCASFRGALAIAVSLIAATSANAVTVSNGGFEGSTPNAPFQTLTGSALPGWTINGSIDLIGSYWKPAEGSNSIDLNGNAEGGISQSLSGLSAGTQYIVSFFISGNPDNGLDTKTATLTLGTGTNPVSYTLSALNSKSMMDWKPVSYSFVADSGGSALFSLQSTTAGAYGLAVDGFSISAAPEPAAWGMMVLGFGVAGAAMRRRRAATTAVA